MKNVTVKVITISSQLLVVTLFLTLVFSGGANNQNITIGNNNFDKMADKTMTLFKSEELLLSSVDTSVVVPLDDDTKKEEIKEEEVKEEVNEEPVLIQHRLFLIRQLHLVLQVYFMIERYLYCSW